MTEKPRVSVIIPARNAGKYIAETFDSLLAQTDASWQAIVINDRSTDNTQAIIDDYAARYPGRFVSYEGPGIGVSSARNLGLDKATGDRIMFLDSDDWVDVRWMELMNGALDANPGAIAAYCGSYRSMRDGRLHRMPLDRELTSDPFKVMARSCAVSIHTVLLDRKELDTVGRFDTSLATSEDWDLWQRLARRGGQWVLVDKYLSYYRTGHTSLSQKVDSIMELGEKVLTRGYSADPRVPDPAPQNANGTRDVVPNEFFNRIGGLSLWCLSSYAGANASMEGGRNLVRPIPGESVVGHWFAGVFIEGFIQGAGIAAENMAASWDAVAPRLDNLLALVNEQWRDDAAIARMRQSVVDLVADRYEGTESFLFEGKHLAGIDLRAPRRLEAFPGIDRVRVKFIDGHDVLGEAEIGIDGAIEPSDWFRIALLCINPSELARRFPAETASARAEQTQRLLGPRGVEQQVLTQRSAGEDVWDTFFASGDDPFSYDTPYEKEKFARAIDILGDFRAGTALELACAEGHFTRLIAQHADRVIATDVAESAIARARKRCSDLANVEFAQLDMVNAPYPGDVDLIYCSEVLYYLADEAAVTAVARKAAEALRPGGRLVLVHANIAQDDPDRRGFDWGVTFGAETIGKIFSATPGLALERSDRTDLYRIELYRKVAGDQAVPAPLINRLPLSALPVGAAWRDIYRGPVTTYASQVDHEIRDFVPVLMYHAVAEEGPKPLDRYRVTPAQFRAQMTWLKDNGFRSMTSRELAWHLETRTKFKGRPVVITFDDGMQNFADNAWPVLKELGLVPEMFLVTDLLGKDSSWDKEYGKTYPLMSRETIRALAAEGVIFGSHMATHPKSDKLSTAALKDELARSYDAMTELLGEAPYSIAAPYGLIDLRYVDMAWRTGYSVAYSCDDRYANLDDLPLLVPRREMVGSWKMHQFVNAMMPSVMPQYPAVESEELISVVVSALNASPTINETLATLRDQTHRNLEIIVVDRGSGDDTCLQIERNAAADRRVRLIKADGAGLAAARNAGWRAATGSTIAFMDAADTADSTKIAKLNSALIGAGETAAVAYSWWNEVSRWGDVIVSSWADFKFGNVLPSLIRRNFAGAGSTALIRRSALEAVGGFDESAQPRGVSGYEDYDLYLRLAERYEFVLFPEYLTGARSLPARKSQDQYGRLQAWLGATDAVVARHPELAAARKKGLRQTAFLHSQLAFSTRRFLDVARIMLLVLPRDPLLSAAIPVRIGMSVGRRIKARLQKFGAAKTLKFYWQRFTSRK